jgi:hypothetical protein
LVRKLKHKKHGHRIKILKEEKDVTEILIILMQIVPNFKLATVSQDGLCFFGGS